MPKKKRRPRKPAKSAKSAKPPTSATPAQRQPPNQAARLGAAFRTSRLERGLDPDDAWIIEVLLELKQSYLGISDPTVWPDQDTYELLTEIVPRRVHVEERDRNRVALTLDDFFTFLHKRGQWSPRSLPFADVPDLIGDLTRDVSVALADPAQRGMTNNIIQYAMSQGVDLTDETAMAEFFQQYNSLDDEQRKAVTETGDPPPETGELSQAGKAAPAGAAFGLGARAPEDHATPFKEESPSEFDLADFWPDFLGDPPDPDTGMAQMASADPHELTATILTQRADKVMALIGDGRKLTKTEVLGRADTAALLAGYGIDETPRSMWDVPELAIVFTALRSGGFVQIRGGAAYPAANPEPWTEAGGDATARLRAVRILHAATFAMLLGTGQEDEEDRAVGNSPLTIPALLKAAEPGGLTVSMPTDPDEEPIAEELLTDLSILVTAGLIEQGNKQGDKQGMTFYCHPALIELTPAAVEAVMENHAADATTPG